MNFKDEFTELFEKLKDYNSHPTENLSETFLCVVKAAFAKCIEYNYFIQSHNSVENSFFHTPFLRGICEDLIVLKYLRKYFSSDKDELLQVYMQYLLKTSIEVQTAYFGQVAPDQISPKKEKIREEIVELEDRLKATMQKNGLNKERIFPSVEHMAIDGKLKQLYDFFYHATSRMVHFSPNILLRMGWYHTDKEGKWGPTIFSSTNFHKYYEQFNKFYAALLFVEFSKTFKTELNLDASFMSIVKKIKKSFSEENFYPELVTFEELNIKRPSDFFRVLKKVIREHEK
ncbi:DUF5677 domain-containing protein [Runella salmonicolor]|uniref:DUF5677 domain-containing protein n=1 Tax=Runella salmonicolor TaxID=2950278 RepID=A0ABT1FSJ4_9BACT|nr:DUF5677 domain-containing protein [Runella salmonicolor]MCP1384470.1 DUF5677 domain-containing protein [Runella salmonicolor]